MKLKPKFPFKKESEPRGRPFFGEKKPRRDGKTNKRGG